MENSINKSFYPKISIIIPTYNRGWLLVESIKSVINQTYKNIEIIVVDDGSTDDTKNIVGEFQKKDNRIVYIYETNSGGPSRPKNTGVGKATGEYVSFLDDDDEWLPEKLEKQISLFSTDNNKNIPAIVSCDSVVVNRQKETPVFSRKKEIGLKSILIKNSIFTGTVLIKTSTIKDMELFDEKLNFLEDWDLWIRILSNNDNIKFCPNILFKYNIREDNTTKTTGGSKKIEALIYVFNKNISLYEKYNVSHIIMFRMAVKYYLIKKYSLAKKYFGLSIQKNKMYLPSYAGYILSIFNKITNPIFSFGIKIYRIVTGRNWGNRIN